MTLISIYLYERLTKGINVADFGTKYKKNKINYIQVPVCPKVRKSINYRMIEMIGLVTRTVQCNKKPDEERFQTGFPSRGWK